MQSFHSYGIGDTPGLSTWRVSDCMMLDCNDKFAEMVGRSVESMKTSANFTCMDLFPARCSEEFRQLKQSMYRPQPCEEEEDVCMYV